MENASIILYDHTYRRKHIHRADKGGGGEMGRGADCERNVWTRCSIYDTNRNNASRNNSEFACPSKAKAIFIYSKGGIFK